jgi:hypothetical protein
MPYLVRKIERPRWVGSDQLGNKIKADVVARCIRPTGSELSVWFAENFEDINTAKLAVLAAGDKLATTDLVVIPIQNVENAGLSIISTEPKVGPVSLKPLHRDIADLDLDSLKKVAEIVQQILIDKKEERLTLSECRLMLEKAIADNIFDKSELNGDIVKKLKIV